MTQSPMIPSMRIDAQSRWAVLNNSHRLATKTQKTEQLTNINNGFYSESVSV